MWDDPIIDEVRRIKAEIAAEFNYDLDALFEHLKRQERESGRTYVSLPPRRIEPTEQSAVPPLDTNVPLDTSPTVES
jgi:hypothetical protein